MFYRSPDLSVCADVIPFFENGEFKLFYLRDYRDIYNKGEGCPWCLLTTKDLVHYEDHGPVLLRGNVDEQDLYVFTGSIFKENDIYYIYYTGHNPHLRQQGFPEQKILRATSKDLLHWDKDPNFVFEAPTYLEKHDFRDPFVYKDEEKNIYCMLLAARLKTDDPINAKGVTLLATSKDLINWELDEKPFYSPRNYFTHECPDLFKMGEYYYLVFSEFTDKIVTTYRVSKSPYGPWETRKVNTFNGHAFYAAKSVSDGKRRIMFGWNPIKDKEKDNNPWQWGGNIIPLELVQDEKDGTLFVKCPHEILESYNKEVETQKIDVLGKSIEGKTISFLNNGFNLVKIKDNSEDFKLTFDFETKDDAGDFGVIFYENKNYSQYYSIKLEPKMNRLCFDRQPRNIGFLHCEVDVERYCPIEKFSKHTLTLIVEGSVVNAYVDDKYAMSTRAFDFNNGNISFYSNNNELIIENIKLFYKGER